MPTPALPALESRPEARLLELNTIHRTRPNLPTAMARAEAGEVIEELDAQVTVDGEVKQVEAELLEPVPTE